jgi:hypothetical protein
MSGSGLVTLKVETGSGPERLFRGIIDLGSVGSVIFLVDSRDNSGVWLVAVFGILLGLISHGCASPL